MWNLLQPNDFDIPCLEKHWESNMREKTVLKAKQSEKSCYFNSPPHSVDVNTHSRLSEFENKAIEMNAVCLTTIPMHLLKFFSGLIFSKVTNIIKLFIPA